MKVHLMTKPNQCVVSPTHNPHTDQYDGKWWRTITNISVDVSGIIHSVPRGFVTDFGSIPKLLQHIVSTADESLLAYILHDYCYKSNGIDCSRKEADKLMYEVSKLCGQHRFVAALVYYTVRLFGRFAFNKHDATFKPISKQGVSDICRDNNYYPTIND